MGVLCSYIGCRSCARTAGARLRPNDAPRPLSLMTRSIDQIRFRNSKNKNRPAKADLFCLELVMGVLCSHIGSRAGARAAPSAYMSKAGAGKGVTGAFAFPPSDSPHYKNPNEKTTLLGGFSFGAGDGSRTHEPRHYQ